MSIISITKYLITPMTTFLICSNVAYSAHVHLEWTSSPSYFVDGYKVHWGTSSRSYNNHFDVGQVTYADIFDLDDETIYYFAVTAYSGDLESGYSNEVAALSGNPVEENVSRMGSGSGGCTLNNNPRFGLEWLFLSFIFLSIFFRRFKKYDNRSKTILWKLIVFPLNRRQ
jgi:hypothetical protein